MADFKKGDKVSWRTPQGMTHGKVVKKITRNESHGDLDIKATPSEPRYLVESDKTGAMAAHTADALNKAD